MIVALVLGFVAAFVTSIPVAGPIAVLVLQATLEGNRRKSVAIALGSAIAETIYAGLAFAGVTTMLTRVPLFLPVVRAIGAVILVIIGVHFIRKNASPANAEAKKEEPAERGWWMGATISALNPTLFVSWTVIVAFLEGTGWLRHDGGTVLAILGFSLGVGAGIVAWYAVLIAGVLRFRKLLAKRSIDRGVHVLGYVLVVIGIAMAIFMVALPLVRNASHAG